MTLLYGTQINNLKRGYIYKGHYKGPVMYNSLNIKKSIFDYGALKYNSMYIKKKY